MSLKPPLKTIPLEPGDTYFDELGRMVFTAQYHLKRGLCCESGCRHCPYDFRKSRAVDINSDAAPAEQAEPIDLVDHHSGKSLKGKNIHGKKTK